MLVTAAMASGMSTITGMKTESCGGSPGIAALVPIMAATKPMMATGAERSVWTSRLPGSRRT
jgi:hypothetical protein